MQRMLTLLFVLGCVQIMGAQSIGLSQHFGYTIANHPRFPAINGISHSTELNYNIEPGTKRYWSLLYNAPTLSLTLNYQGFGNDKVLGRALGFAPIMGFYLLRKPHWKLQGQMGWGIAYLSKRYDGFDNPENVVIGSHLNAYASARLRLGYQIGQFQPYVGILVAHYSNANIQAPNLGLNVPSLQVGLNYVLKETTEIYDRATYKSLKEKIEFQPRLRIQGNLGLGASAVVPRGPLFPVYVGQVGAGWHWRPAHVSSAGMEYSFNTATYQFRVQSQTQLKKSDFQRAVFWMSHEFLIGQVGFYTLGGLYLNKHVDQRSNIATELGLNFYLQNPLIAQRNNLSLGIHIRAYFGLAEFVMLQLQYRW